MQPMEYIAARAAKKVGQMIANFHHNRHKHALKVQSKGLDGLVTQIDREAERLLVATLQESYPNHSYLGEEFGFLQGRGADAEWCWIIDPLDGTHNFVHGMPHFCVSVAVQKNGVTEHAAVYDPIRDELFSASRNDGARLNQRRIYVAQKTQLAGGFFTTGHPFEMHKNGKAISHARPHFESLLAMVSAGSQVRRTGSAALDLCYVACGRFDGYFEMSIKPWDIAAGALIVLEARGAVSDERGGDGFFKSGVIFASNPKILRPMMQCVLEAWGQAFLADIADNDHFANALARVHDDSKFEYDAASAGDDAPDSEQQNSQHDQTQSHNEIDLVPRVRIHLDQVNSLRREREKNQPRRFEKKSYDDKSRQDDNPRFNKSKFDRHSNKSDSAKPRFGKAGTNKRFDKTDKPRFGSDKTDRADNASWRGDKYGDKRHKPRSFDDAPAPQRRRRRAPSEE